MILGHRLRFWAAFAILTANTFVASGLPESQTELGVTLVVAPVFSYVVCVGGGWIGGKIWAGAGNLGAGLWGAVRGT